MTKNAQLVEIYQEIYNPEGSDYFFLLAPICGQTLPRPLSADGNLAKFGYAFYTGETLSMSRGITLKSLTVCYLVRPNREHGISYLASRHLHSNTHQAKSGFFRTAKIGQAKRNDD